MDTKGKLIEVALSDLGDMIDFINNHVNVRLNTPTQQSMYSIGCFDLAIEYQASIFLLATNELYGSVFCMLRPLYESYIRGQWFAHCANDQDVEKFRKGKINQKMAEMVAAVEVKLNFSNSVLSKVHNSIWRGLNDFTHSGHYHIAKRHQPGYVKHNYKDEEIAQILEQTKVMGGLAAIGLAEFAIDSDLPSNILNKLRRKSITE